MKPSGTSIVSISPKKSAQTRAPGFEGQDDIAGRIVTPDEDLIGIKPKLRRQPDSLAGAVLEQFCAPYFAHTRQPS